MSEKIEICSIKHLENLKDLWTGTRTWRIMKRLRGVEMLNQKKNSEMLCAWKGSVLNLCNPEDRAGIQVRRRQCFG